MCHDLLDLDGNRYVPEVTCFYPYTPCKYLQTLLVILTGFQVLSKSNGTPEKKEVLLEDHDPVWLELRHAHVAEVSTYASAFSAMQLFK